MIVDVCKFTLKRIRDLIQNGEVSPLTVTLETLKRIKEHIKLNSFITVSEDLAMETARASTERIAKKEQRSLEGIPLAIKDLFCTKGIPTTSASKLLEGFVPRYESTVTHRLLESGMVPVGKTNMDEFAMGSSNQTSYFGPVRNPWNSSCVPGGSSGGSAAAVAAYLCYAALGSDTGGSVRQPAAFSGIVGLKPSYGRCSRYGMIAYSSSLDQAGVMARTVDDACIVLDKMMGRCANDSTTSHLNPPKLEDVSASVKGKSIGYIAPHMDLVGKSIRKVWEDSLEYLKSNGANIIEINLRDLDDDPTDNNPIDRWIGTYYVLTPVEAYSNLCRYDGIRYGSYLQGADLEETYRLTRSQFGEEVRRRIMLGAHILLQESKEALYNKAVVYRKLMQEKFMTLFKKVDAIISPTSPHEAFELGTSKSALEMYAEDGFTVIANLLGSPAISIPACCGENKLPIAMQVITNRFEEVKLIEIAKSLEQYYNFTPLSEVNYAH
jgi:aspartyl-tRNA(Asn)/glutamyl-tRNA(Gln) amidotransferase subunit A